MSLNQSERPVVRILHQLGRSGGTLIAKCLAVMDDAVLLSEVHPYNREMVKTRGKDALPYFPAVQADLWFNLLTEDDIRTFQRSGPPKDFASEIALIDERCRARGKNLILRDFNNLDFTGINFRAQPAFRFSTYEALKDMFEPVRFFTVRHPADQWVSVSKLFEEDASSRLGSYLYGCLLFAEQAAETGFVRYEDFTHDPEAALQTICSRLALPYDPGWWDRWADYRNITGDSRARKGEDRISPYRKTPLGPDLQRKLDINADYRRTLDLLGYE